MEQSTNIRYKYNMMEPIKMLQFISFIEIFIAGFYVFCSTSCCSSLDAMLNGSSQGSICESLMAAFKVSAALYLVVYRMDSVGWTDFKKVCLTPSLFVCRRFYSCTHTVLQCLWGLKKPYVFIMLLLHFFLPADLDRHNKDHTL